MIVESRHAPYPLKRPIPEWEIRSCRKQERERIRNYEYMPNRLQRGAEIYKHHLEMKAKSQQYVPSAIMSSEFLFSLFVGSINLSKEY